MNPLLSIWSQPKNTVQYMLDNKPISYLIFLAILSSFASGILAFADQGFLVEFSLPVILLIITILSIIGTIAGLGIIGCYLHLDWKVIRWYWNDTQYELCGRGRIYTNNLDDATWDYRSYPVWKKSIYAAS